MAGTIWNSAGAISSRHVVRSLARGACAVLAACGGGSHAGMPDGPPDPTPQTIKIHVTSDASPALIAFRDGPDAPWQTPAATAPGRYEIVVHGPYTIEGVCTVPHTARAVELLRTPDDPHEVDLLCVHSATGPGPAISHVTGSMGTSGLISVGKSTMLVGLDGAFDLQVVDGTYDVIARTPSDNAAADRIAIRRNLVVAGDTIVTPAFDVAAEGTATVFVHTTATNITTDDRVLMSGGLTTPTASSSFTYLDLQGVHLLPDAALGPDDAQSISVGASINNGNEFTSRTITRRYTAGTSVVFNLPPAIKAQYATAGSQPVVTWTTPPPFDELRFGLGQDQRNSAGLVTEHDVRVSASYVAATGITSAAFDTDLPGYDPAWRTEFTLPWGHDEQATRTDGGDTITSFHSEDITP